MSGTAVLTAVQAQQKPIDEIAELIKDRRFDEYTKGRNAEQWLSDFWKNMAIMEAQRMSEEKDEQIEELASIIYSECGIKIRNDECYTIAGKLVELGYKRAEEENDVKETQT